MTTNGNGRTAFAPVANGDRVRFTLTQPMADGQHATQMQGDGYVLAVVGNGGTPICFVGVLGYPGVLNVPAAVCEVIEPGALVRKIALSS